MSALPCDARGAASSHGQEIKPDWTPSVCRNRHKNSYSRYRPRYPTYVIAQASKPPTHAAEQALVDGHVARLEALTTQWITAASKQQAPHFARLPPQQYHQVHVKRFYLHGIGTVCNYDRYCTAVGGSYLVCIQSVHVLPGSSALTFIML